MIPINADAAPAIFKVIHDAEDTLGALTGSNIKLVMSVRNEQVTKEELAKLRLQNIVCCCFNVTWKEIASPTRHRQLVNARKAYVHVAINVLRLTTTEVGRDIGNRDHTSVMYLRDSVKDLIEINDSITILINQIKATFYESVC